MAGMRFLKITLLSGGLDITYDRTNYAYKSLIKGVALYFVAQIPSISERY